MLFLGVANVSVLRIGRIGIRSNIGYVDERIRISLIFDRIELRTQIFARD